MMRIKNVSSDGMIVYLVVCGGLERMGPHPPPCVPLLKAGNMIFRLNILNTFSTPERGKGIP